MRTFVAAFLVVWFGASCHGQKAVPFHPAERPEPAYHAPKADSQGHGDSSASSLEEQTDKVLSPDPAGGLRSKRYLPKFDYSQVLQQIYPQPLAKDNIRLVSLVSDNDDTEKALRANHDLRSMRLRPKGYSFEDVEATLKANAGKVVFFIGHTDRGKFVVTNSAGHLKAPPIDLRALYSRARQLKVVPIILGCNSAHFVSAGVTCPGFLIHS